MTQAQDLHALLDQTGWIHALARKLVADPHLAADLAQQTTVDALERGPDGFRPLRGWLATVMRNNLAKLRRGEGNRSARERQDARGAALEPSAHDVVEKAEMHRNVVQAVLALDEPYRSALLMRFFEHLSYAEIARRTGVTEAAVNSRITRGLEQLRARLESTYGGDRRALALALFPLAKLPTGVATTFLGVEVMHWIIGTAAASFLAVGVSVGLSGGGRAPAAPARTATTASPEREESSARDELAVPLFYDHGPRQANLPAPGPLAPQRQQQDERNTWKTELFASQAVPASAESLALSTSNGDVEAVESTSGQLEIQARVRVRTDQVPASALTQLFQDHVDVFEEDGVLHVEDKHRNERGWSVSFTVGVPAKLPLVANSGNGSVRVRTARNAVTANSGNGDVVVDLPRESVESIVANTGNGDIVVAVAAIRGKLVANSGNGDVRMHVSDPTSPGSAAVSTGNGSVHLALPPSFSGSLALETGNGEIVLPRSFGIAVKRSGDGSKAKGTVGNGQGSFELGSGQGDIEIELGNALPEKKAEREER